jgi:hypothetical protein
VVSFHQPRFLYSVLTAQNLNLEDCVELEQDIKMYLSLEKSPINIEFWEVSAAQQGRSQVA